MHIYKKIHIFSPEIVKNDADMTPIPSSGNWYLKRKKKELPGGPGVGLRALTAKGLGPIPGWGTKIPQPTRHGPKKKKTERERKHV